VRAFARVLRDNTERKRVEDALMESEWRHQQALEAGDLGTLIIDFQAGTAQLSARARDMLGLAAAMPDRATAEALIHPDDRDGVVGAARAAIASDSDDAYRQTFRIVRPDGEIRWIRCHARVVRQPGSERVAERAVGAISDMTDQREAEESLRRLNDLLGDRVAERTAQVRELSRQLTLAEQEERQRISQMLHDDLQQQLYALGATLDLLREASELEQARLWERSDSILADVTALARSISMDLSPPILAEARVGPLLEWIAERKRNRFHIVVHLTIGDPDIRLDRPVREILYRSLQEILFNAVKHAGTRQVEIAAEASDGEFKVIVRDEGVGFDPAAVVTRAGATGGWGLATARERLALIGGRLELDSALGQGAIARIVVPVQGGTADPSAEGR
jgi:PAS domain S-box-containing protein